MAVPSAAWRFVGVSVDFVLCWFLCMPIQRGFMSTGLALKQNIVFRGDGKCYVQNPGCLLEALDLLWGKSGCRPEILVLPGEC